MVARRWTAARLGELHAELIRSVPARRVDGNVLVANWSMRRLGREEISLPEWRYYLAGIISAFDVVTVQEVHEELGEGRLGNQERFAILHYEPRVQFEHVSGEVVLQPSELIDGEQFARKPLIASFRAGEMRFRVCTAHLSYGGSGGKDVARTAKEAEALGRHLVRRATRRDRQGIVLSANLNLRRKDSRVVAALREAGVDLLDGLLVPNVAMIGSEHISGAIGFVSPNGELRGGPSEPNCAVFDFRRVLFRPEHLSHYRDAGLYSPDEAQAQDERAFLRWAVLNVTDHLPLWAELDAG